MATKTFKVALSLDNPRIVQSGINVRSFDKQSIKIKIELTKNSQVYQIPTGAQIKISLLKLARQEQKIILDVPFTSADSIDWVVPDYLDGYQGEVRVGIYLIVGTENIDVGYFNITSSVSDIDSAAEEFTESVLQGWAIEDLTALLPKFQEVLDETTGKDVISAPEIILARGGAQTLGERLDSEKAEVTAQLAQIAIQLPKSNGTDDTLQIQSVIDYVSNLGGGNIIVNDTYLINDTGVKMKSNVSLEFREKGKFKKIPSNVSWSFIVEIMCENVTIINAVLEGDRSESETRTVNGFFISTGAKKIKIVDAYVMECWGNGFSIGSAAGSGRIEDIEIIRPKCIHNGYLGIAITDAKNLYIEEPFCVNTDGEPPRSGIDIEPNANTADLENIRIKGGYYGQNSNSGLVIALDNMKNNLKTISITVDGGVFEDNDLAVYYPPNCKGHIRIINPTIIRGRINLQRCYADSIKVIIDDPVIEDYALNDETIGQSYSSGIIIGAGVGHTVLGALGGITVNNPIISTTNSNAFGGINLGDYSGSGATIKDVTINNYRCKGGKSELTMRDNTVLSNVFLTPSKDTDKSVDSLIVLQPNVIYTVLTADSTATAIFNLWTNFVTMPNGLEFTYNNLSPHGVNLQFGTNLSTKPMKVGILSPTTAIRGLTTTDIGAKIKLKKISSDMIIVTEMLGTWSTIAY